MFISPFFDTPYPALQSTYHNGMLYFPDEFLSEFYKPGKLAAGFVDIEHDDEKVTSCVWNEEAYQEWLAAQPDPLIAEKAARVAQSKADLETYLNTHPITWTDGLQYSITRDKQQQLTSKILTATIASQLSRPYTLTWNSTGEVCKEWTLEQLTPLAFAIDSRVTALVSYQQEKEVEIRNCKTLEEVEAVVVDYDEVE